MLEVTTKKISENKAQELYNELIKEDILALNKEKDKGKDKRENILRILQRLRISFYWCLFAL